MNKAGYTYTGDKIIPTVTVWDKTTPLTEKTDYTIAYKNNTNAGKATITVTGKGNYSGKETFTFDITPANMESDVYADTFYVKINAKKAQKPVPELYYMGTKLKNNKDFTIAYPNKSGIYAKKGEYTVTLTGKNNFTGKKTLTLTAVNAGRPARLQCRQVTAKKSLPRAWITRYATQTTLRQARRQLFITGKTGMQEN